MFSSKIFIVLEFTFRSLINFEIVFVYGVRSEFDFILLQESHNIVCDLFSSDGKQSFKIIEN